MNSLDYTCIVKFLWLVLFMLAACHGSVAHKQPKDTPVNKAITQMWQEDVERIAEDGDVLLTRSYSLTGDIIVLGSAGESVTHSSIINATNKTVIESIPEGTVISPLSKIVAPRNRYIIMIRFSHLAPLQRRAGLLKAQSKVGTAYDYSGLIGIDDKEKYYCSELIYWAFDLAQGQSKKETVVAPSDLMRYGEVVYFSGARDDPQVISAAQEKARRRGR